MKHSYLSVIVLLLFFIVSIDFLLQRSYLLAIAFALLGISSYLRRRD